MHEATWNTEEQEKTRKNCFCLEEGIVGSFTDSDRRNLATRRSMVLDCCTGSPRRDTSSLLEPLGAPSGDRSSKKVAGHAASWNQEDANLLEEGIRLLVSQDMGSVKDFFPPHRTKEFVMRSCSKIASSKAAAIGADDDYCLYSAVKEVVAGMDEVISNGWMTRRVSRSRTRWMKRWG